jgi:hypothetical protein
MKMRLFVETLDTPEENHALKRAMCMVLGKNRLKLWIQEMWDFLAHHLPSSLSRWGKNIDDICLKVHKIKIFLASILKFVLFLY